MGSINTNIDRGWVGQYQYMYVWVGTLVNNWRGLHVQSTSDNTALHAWEGCEYAGVLEENTESPHKQEKTNEKNISQ